MSKNSINQIRPTSTFESFKPQNEQQFQVCEKMQGLVVKITKRIEVASGQLEFDHARLD